MQIMYQDGGRDSAEYGPKVMRLFQRPCVLVVAEFLSIIFEFANFILLNCYTEGGGRGGGGSCVGTISYTASIFNRADLTDFR